MAVIAMPTMSATDEPRLGLEDVDIQRLGMAAMRFIRMIEQGDIGLLWDAASEMLRRAVPREEFVATMVRDRRVLGRGTDRRWTSVRIDRPRDGASLPPATYAALEFSASLGRPAEHAREVVTLRWENGSVWRFAGYGVRFG